MSGTQHAVTLRSKDQGQGQGHMVMKCMPAWVCRSYDCL